MVHHNGQWVPLSASYLAFLMGINQKRPECFVIAQGRATSSAWRLSDPRPRSRQEVIWLPSRF
jgi:hypothetical protein